MFPELNNLTLLIKRHQLVVTADEKKDSLIGIYFETNRSKWKLYIEDECGDFDLKNQALCIYLTLKSLEDYRELSDFLEWSNYYYLNASDSFWLQYYRDLGSVYAAIEKEIGKIDPFIAGIDYELRSGAFDALVRSIK